MHGQVRTGKYVPGLRFLFCNWSLDETADRNNNGIIDSIDDTLDLIKEFVGKGYNEQKDICYVNYEDGRHDIPTWGKSNAGFFDVGFWKSGRQQQDRYVKRNKRAAPVG
jgi:hypothetical protein